MGEICERGSDGYEEEDVGIQEIECDKIRMQSMGRKQGKGDKYGIWVRKDGEFKRMRLKVKGKKKYWCGEDTGFLPWGSMDRRV